MGEGEEEGLGAGSVRGEPIRGYRNLLLRGQKVGSLGGKVRWSGVPHFTEEKTEAQKN